MTRGVLIHAYNNTQIDYTLIALCNALAIKANLQVPVCLVTDNGSIAWLKKNHGITVDKAFDHIIIAERETEVGERRFNDTASTSHILPWHNTNRVDSYALSPFDQTLLVDADYFILDDRLNLVWDAKHDVMINRQAMPLDYGPTPHRERWLEHTGIELCWATCVYFRKSLAADMLFTMIDHVRKHYDYYSHIYGFPVHLFRNDYAFSIAIHMLSGFTKCDDIGTLPVPVLLTSFDNDELIDVPAKNDLTFLMADRHDGTKFMVTRTKKSNVHVMNKFSIVRQAGKFIELYQ